MPMNDEIIEPIESVPVLSRTICKISALILYYNLRYASLFIALIVWYNFHLFYALGALFMGFLITGIIKAKMRDLAIPQKQHERNYTDKELAIWFVDKEVCWRL